MRLKKLVLLGFKSFADKISLDFSGNIMGIVGPNGCGKSNIVDAFRWVMGEQSAKSMRGDKMPDVIFAGTDMRKALNYAEVSLTFDNEDKLLPIEFEEVTITRRLHRSGESEYFINKNQVRLKDIHSLFWDSGLGKDAFSIFEQGKLDQIIHLSPIERRPIFDETAGIERFLQRKKEAIKKLEHVNENYNRLKDVHSEVQKHAKTLEKQAQVALKYRENEEELKRLEQSLLYSKWLQANQALENENHHWELFQKKIQEEQSAILFLEQQNQKIKGEYKEIDQKARLLKEEAIKFHTEIKLAQAENQRWLQRKQEIEARLQKLSKESQNAVEVALKEEKQHATSLNELKNLEKELLNDETALKKCLQKQQEHENLVQQLQNSNQQMRSKIFEEEKHFQILSHQVKEHEIHLENFYAKQQKNIQWKQKHEEQRQMLHAEIEGKRKGVKEITAEVERQKKDLAQIESQLEEANLALQSSRGHLDAIQKDLTALTARENALIRLKQDLEGFSKSSKTFLKHSKDPQCPFYNELEPLCELIKPEGSHQNAPILLKPYLQTLAVKTKKGLTQVLRFAQEQSLQDYSFFCLEDVRSSLEEHFFEETNMRSGPSSGLFIDNKNVLFSYSDSKSENNLFLRQSELKELAKKIKDNQNLKKDLELELESAQKSKEVLNSQRINLDKEQRKKEIALIQENFQLQKCIAQNEEINNQLEAFTKEEKELTTAIETRQSLIAQAKEDLHKQKALFEEISKEAKKQELLLSEKLAIQKEISRNFFETQEAFRKKEKMIQKLKQEVQLFLMRNEERKIAILKMQEEQNELKASIKSLEEGKLKSDQDAKLLHCEKEVLEVQLKQEEESLQKARKLLQKNDDLIREKKDSLQSLDKEKLKKEFKKEEHLIKIQEFEKDLFERFQKSMQEAAKDVFSQSDFEAIEKRIRTLRLELEKVGNVNFNAIEGYEEQKKRHDFLSLQLDDLSTTQKDIQQLIQKLEAESRKLFKTTFETIRGHFQKNFQILFRGGEADLKFTESQDPLEAGIEIVAKPPGKQMKSITLLSGGEKCLTALALLFSLFEVKPAPFCVLDEVDAPLDESNVMRFTELLKQFVERTQFILITHNKKTMAIADILFGVSMEEKGVSKLISLEFEKKEPLTLLEI